MSPDGHVDPTGADGVPTFGSPCTQSDSPLPSSPAVEISDTDSAYYERLQLPDAVLEFFGCTITPDLHNDLLGELGVKGTTATVQAIVFDSGEVTVAAWWRAIAKMTTLNKIKQRATDLQLLTIPLINLTTCKYRAVYFFVCGLQSYQSGRMTGRRSDATTLVSVVQDLLRAMEADPTLERANKVWISVP